MVNKIKSKSRNKVEELLIAERVVNGLKYAQGINIFNTACNILISYATLIRAQASYIADNMKDPVKMQTWNQYIYSLLYASDMLGLSSLK